VQAALRVDRAGVEAADLVVDVREPEEYAGAVLHGEARGGHIPGARSIPWQRLLTEDPGIPVSSRIVVYCTGGVRSGMAWLMLRQRGYANVSNYDGSWWEWAREGGD
jgi:thiosulfate/3-mercaptopyruvate sulfurtransferase